MSAPETESGVITRGGWSITVAQLKRHFEKGQVSFDTLYDGIVDAERYSGRGKAQA